jgi:VPDSG-CTERM motif
MKSLKYTILILVVAVCALFSVQPAKAQVAPTTFESILNVGNDAGLVLGPYGTVDVSLTGQTATITFTAAAGFSFGDGNVADVNVNSSSFTEAIVTDSDFKDFSSGNVDGFGTFNLVIDNNSFSVKLSTIVFTVTNTGTPWADASAVLAFNSKGFDAAAHIFTTNTSFPTGITGFAGENGTGIPTVPDSGTTAMLLGGALVGLGAVRRYIKH